MEQLRRLLVGWIGAKVEEANALGTVVGLSGGIDSAVVAALCREALGDRVLALILPVNSLPQDAEDARLVAEHLGIRVREVPLEIAYAALVTALPNDLGSDEGKALALANLKPRLRMLTLYYHANALNYLVVGTGNRSELAMGYFTKFGDGAADILPLGGLVKHQVRELARHLGVPQSIIDKPPSAGLRAGQTDEGEMGLTYAQIDGYLLSGQADPAVAQLLISRQRQSEHKRSPAPIAPVDDLLDLAEKA